MTGIGDVISNLEDKILNKSDEKSKLMAKAIDTLFSNEPNKILQTTRFKDADIYWVTAVELLNHFIVKDYCDVKNQMNIQSAINTLYQSRVSLKGKGREELFDALAVENRILDMLNPGDEKRKA